MKRNIIVLILGIALLAMGVLIGRSVIPVSQVGEIYMPQLTVIGDVGEVVEISSIKSGKSTDTEFGKPIKFIELKSLIDLAKPVTENYDVLLVGQDGLFAQLEGENLDDCSIKFSDINGWESITTRHPINSRIKNIKEIVVISKDNDWDYGFNLISTRENIMNITPGQLYLKELNLYPYFDGKSTKKSDGRDYNVRLYKQRRLLPIKNIVSNEFQYLLMMGSNGVYEVIGRDGYLELMGNKINYVNPEERKQVHGIKGIMTDFSPDSIMNLYHDTVHYLENDEDVLIVILDGFAYHQYEYSLSKEYIPFLASKDAPKLATSVYKPVTNVGFAAMITGQPPHINGVHDRRDRDLKTQSIFGKAQELGKKSVLIEGDIKILNTEIEPILNIDKNSNGTRDDEIFESALAHIKNKPNLVMVHFHSIDDMGHKHGDLSEETMKTIKTIDEYVKELSASWKGKIIITSDHGMHKTPEGGTHGMFRYEDLIVPYFLLEGEDKR